MAAFDAGRIEFAERLAKLAGGTTYRTPTGGRGTKQDQLPDAHAIAAALAFARRGDDDIGPDVAFCWVLQSDAYRNKVCRRMAVALQSHHTRWVGAHRLAAAEAAWATMIHDQRGSHRPPACPPRDWDSMLLASIAVMNDSAWDSLAEAERRYSRAA